MNMRSGSINTKSLLRDLIVIIKAINILFSQHGRDVIHQDAFIIMDRPQWDDGSKSANGAAGGGA